MHLERRGSHRNMAEIEAMVEVDREAQTLRAALRSQHKALQFLQGELDEERNASAIAATETMGMIARLQKEKAAVLLEAHQYKRLVEEKIAHYQETVEHMEELLYRKDEAIASLQCEVQAYRHRLLSMGFEDLEIGKIKWPGLQYLHDGEREQGHENSGGSEPEKLDRTDSLHSLEAPPSTLRLCSGASEHGKDKKKNADANFCDNNLSMDGIDSETTTSTPAMQFIDDSLSPWERIEKLQDRLQQLSKSKGQNCYFNDEWIALNRELQKAVTAYTASLDEEANSGWRDSAGGSGIAYESIVDDGQSSLENANLSIEECDTDDGVQEIRRNTANATSSSEDLDSNHNVHDVYVVQHDCAHTGGSDSTKGSIMSLDVSGDDRLGKPEPFPHKTQTTGPSHVPESVERNVLTSHFSELVENKGHGIPTVNADPLEDQVKELTKRLQYLEADKGSMQQTIDSLMKEREELSLLKDVAQQFGLVKTSTSASNPTTKSNKPQQEDQSVVRFMKGILPFSGPRSNLLKNDAPSHSGVGLSHVLEKSPPKKASTFVNRIVRVDALSDNRNNNQDKSSKGFIIRK